MYTTTFARAPLSPLTTVGGMTAVGFACMHAGDALMSIGLESGSGPATVTVPLSDPAVAGSRVAPGPGGSPEPWLPQPEITNTKVAAIRPKRRRNVMRTVVSGYRNSGSKRRT